MDTPQTSHVRISLGLLLGWLVPGLGHLLYGRKDKAVLFFALIMLAFGVGLFLGDARVVSAERFPLYLLAQVWNGGPTLLALWLTGDLRIEQDIPYLDVALLYTAVAGLLNVVILVDLYEVHLKVKEGRLEGAAAGGRPR
jgi:hypothetical protein